METIGASLGIVSFVLIGIFLVILAIITILLPFIILNIRTQAIKANETLETISKRLAVFNNNYLKITGKDKKDKIDS